jgi:hypothetical protein
MLEDGTQAEPSVSHFITDYKRPSLSAYLFQKHLDQVTSFGMFIALLLAAVAFNWQSLAEYDQRPVLPNHFEYDAWNIPKRTQNGLQSSDLESPAQSLHITYASNC